MKTVEVFYRNALTGACAAFLFSGVAAAEVPPSAHAGKNVIAWEGETIAFDAAESTADTTASYQWEQILGPTIAHANAASPRWNFTAPVSVANTPVLRAFQLTVTSPSGERATDSVYVVVLHRNHPPVAAISAAASVNRDTILLASGNATDADGDPLTYLWYQKAGPAARLANGAAAESIWSFGDLTKGQFYPYRIEIGLLVSDGMSEPVEATQAVLITDTLEPDLKKIRPTRTPQATAFRELEWTRADTRRHALSEAIAGENTRATTALAANDTATALHALSNVLALDPTNREALSRFQSLEASSRKHFSDLLNQGHSAFREKKYLEAMRAYRLAAVQRPNHPLTDALTQTCLLALEQENSIFLPVPAGTPSTEKKTANPTLSRTYYGLGLRFYAYGKLEEASDAWEKAARLDPENVLAANAYKRVRADLQRD